MWKIRSEIRVIENTEKIQEYVMPKHWMWKMHDCNTEISVIEIIENTEIWSYVEDDTERWNNTLHI